jgi:hypothetical protein
MSSVHFKSDANVSQFAPAISELTSKSSLVFVVGSAIGLENVDVPSDDNKASILYNKVSCDQCLGMPMEEICVIVCIDKRRNMKNNSQ